MLSLNSPLFSNHFNELAKQATIYLLHNNLNLYYKTTFYIWLLSIMTRTEVNISSCCVSMSLSDTATSRCLAVQDSMAHLKDDECTVDLPGDAKQKPRKIHANQSSRATRFARPEVQKTTSGALPSRIVTAPFGKQARTWGTARRVKRIRIAPGAWEVLANAILVIPTKAGIQKFKDFPLRTK